MIAGGRRMGMDVGVPCGIIVIYFGLKNLQSGLHDPDS
jgi:hypothetical protein